jgi:hypothetical protein
MKFKRKSAFIMWAAGCFFSLILSACSYLGIDAPHIVGDNEVPPAMLKAPRLVATPSADDVANQSWPRLGDVPSKPNDFSSQQSINQTRAQMERDRAEAHIIEQQYQNPPPLIPPPAIQP